jgi:hypothetical protein
MVAGSFVEGQHVVARRDLDGWMGPAGYPRVRKGTTGVIVQRPAGLFSDRYVVDFSRSGQMHVHGRDLKPTLFGPRNDFRAGVHLGLILLIAIPVLFALTRYYIGGGSTSGLISALPEAVLGGVLGLVEMLSLPVLACILGVVWLRHRHRR